MYTKPACFNRSGVFLKRILTTIRGGPVYLSIQDWCLMKILSSLRIKLSGIVEVLNLNCETQIILCCENRD